MRRLLLIALLLGAVLALSACDEFYWLFEDDQSPSPSGASHIVVEYSFDATKQTVSQTYDSFHRASIGSSFPAEGVWPEILYDSVTRTYTVNVSEQQAWSGILSLAISITLSEDGNSITHLSVHRQWEGRVDTIEATNIPIDTDWSDDWDLSNYDGYTVYRLRRGPACGAVISLVGIDNDAIPEPTTVIGFGCVESSYLEIAIRP